MPAYRPIKERFHEKYEVVASGCWEWKATKVTGGYGMIGGGPGSQNLLAHRVSYELAKGEIPDGMLVCHRCDNPSCVNPEHLFLADHSENMKDMERKGRARLLSRESVEEVRLMLQSGYSQAYVARHFGVNRETIRRAIWKPLASDENRVDPSTLSRYTKLTDVQKTEVLSRVSAGEAIATIARAYNVDRKTVRNLRAKQT